MTDFDTIWRTQDEIRTVVKMGTPISGNSSMSFIEGISRGKTYSLYVSELTFK